MLQNQPAIQVGQSGQGEEQGNDDNFDEQDGSDKEDERDKEDENDDEDAKSVQAASIDSQPEDVAKPGEDDEQWRLARMSQIDLELGFPSSFTTQLIQLMAKAAHRKEEETIQRSWQEVRRSRMWHHSMRLASKAARVSPLLALSHPIRSALHELQLFWLTMQLMVLVWLATRMDLYARLRGPFDHVPGYMAHRMPWIPQQARLYNHVKVFLTIFGSVYLPIVFLHFVYVLDDLPDETPLQLARKVIYAHGNRQSVRRSRRWSFDPRFDQFKRPRRRQWASLVLLFTAILLCMIMIILISGHCNATIQSGRWKRLVSAWLDKMVQEYYNEMDATVTQPVSELQPSLPTKVALDRIQVIFRCCGQESYRDFLKSKRKQAGSDTKTNNTNAHTQSLLATSIIPFSCCHRNGGAACKQTNLVGSGKNSLYAQGCTKPVVDLVLKKWSSIMSTALFTLFLMTIPQIILCLSIIQPKEAFRQLARTFIDIGLFFKFWQEMTKATRQKARERSLLQKRKQKDKELREHLNELTERILSEDAGQQPVPRRVVSSGYGQQLPISPETDVRETAAFDGHADTDSEDEQEEPSQEDR